MKLYWQRLIIKYLILTAVQIEPHFQHFLFRLLTCTSYHWVFDKNTVLGKMSCFIKILAVHMSLVYKLNVKSLSLGYISILIKWEHSRPFQYLYKMNGLKVLVLAVYVVYRFNRMKTVMRSKIVLIITTEQLLSKLHFPIYTMKQK